VQNIDDKIVKIQNAIVSNFDKTLSKIDSINSSSDQTLVLLSVNQTAIDSNTADLVNISSQIMTRLNNIDTTTVSKINTANTTIQSAITAQNTAINNNVNTKTASVIDSLNTANTSINTDTTK